MPISSDGSPLTTRRRRIASVPVPKAASGKVRSPLPTGIRGACPEKGRHGAGGDSHFLQVAGNVREIDDAMVSRKSIFAHARRASARSGPRNAAPAAERSDRSPGEFI